MKKLDMFDGIYSQVHRYFFGFVRALSSQKKYLICCIRADQDMQERQQSRDKLQQSTLQAWLLVYFGVLPHS